MISISEKSALLEIYTKPFEKKLRNQWLHVQWSSSSVELHWQLNPFLQAQYRWKRRIHTSIPTYVMLCAI